MNKHTPGPWHHHAKLTASENHRGFSIRAARWAVAEAQPINEDGMEGEANARLIAAAPELLEALKLARLHLGDYGMPDDCKSAKYIDAAIAKATESA